MKKLKWIGVISLVILIGVSIKIYGYNEDVLPADKVKIVFDNGAIVNSEVAQNLELQRLGLGGREYLGENKGMLFMYNNSEIRNFWMKGMLIPIDIIWLSEGRVVGIDADAQPPLSGGAIEKYSSKKPVDLVLEVNAGFAKKNGIIVGSTYEIE